MDKFLSLVMKGRMNDHTAKYLLKQNMLGFSLIKSSVRIRWCTRRITIDFLSPLKDIPILSKTKHAVHVWMFYGFPRDSDVMPLFLFIHRLKLNTEAYTKYLEEVGLPWMNMATARDICDTITPNICPPDNLN